MYPEIIKLGPISIYSYGLMLGIAFITASYLLTLELKRVNLNVNIASEITTIALVFGIIGAKLFHLFEYWDEFINDPLMAFSPAGLTFYGGFLLATLAIFIYIKRKKLSFLQIADLNAPGLALAYGIARIGCHLSGDGDYGIVSNLPWAYSYAKGTVPTPPGVTVHPTPIYELIAGILIFMFLWSKRKKYNVNGKLFFVYLILTAIARFLVEIIRINPRLLLGLSEAQIISIILIIISIIALIILKKKEQISL
ncbi:MAG TPA: prolipoprotein diacylglyceryl transferase [Ignavibacteria bacterium]|jgi:phosphatidylglycerol:prolipoprotein diacylglycerol transferase